MRKSLYILGQLNDEDVEWMLTYGERRTVSQKDVLIRQGEPVEDLYLILEGSFTVTDERGGRRELARLGSGEIVGEMSFVDTNPPSATVTALIEGVVLALPRDSLRQKLDQDSAFAARFYHALAVFLADRVRATVSRLGYGSPLVSPDPDIMQDDELDPTVLDSVHLAGRRFKHILERLGHG